MSESLKVDLTLVSKEIGSVGDPGGHPGLSICGGGEFQPLEDEVGPVGGIIIGTDPGYGDPRESSFESCRAFLLANALASS